jgi:nucleotide-binding universal stress UspA family protein
MANSGIEKVVVGVDGSPDARKALRWAQDYAERTGAALTLVNAYHWPSTYGVALVMEEWDPAIDAQRLLEKARADLFLADDRVHLSAVQGSAAEVLTGASRRADLLVIGTRGHGSFAEAVMGSVSSHCVHHAHCPVVVVR